jgi:hypothetical protein
MDLFLTVFLENLMISFLHILICLSFLSLLFFLTCIRRSEENVKNKIINFEIKNFAEYQYGIDTATEELNLVFEDIANKSCKFIP